MKVGDLIRWRWYLSTHWDKTEFTGVVLGSRIAKTDWEKVRILSVFASDGTVVDVREDEARLEVIT